MYFYTRNKDKEKTNWHLWFAWRPVVVDYTPDGDSKWIWWKWIYRCRMRCLTSYDIYPYYWESDYREKL